MSHEDLKSKAKGQRPEGLPKPADYETLYKEIQTSDKGRKLSIQEIVENASVVNALFDILLEDNVIEDKDGVEASMRVDKAINLYGGVLNALIMILKEDGLVKDLEEKLEDGILASHRTMLHFGTREISVEEIINFRQDVYRGYRKRRAQ
jgi:hypothetical protein